MFGHRADGEHGVAAAHDAAVVAAHDDLRRRPSRSIDVARAPFSRLTPRFRKSSSSTAATSGSLLGSTCWRLTTSVTLAPNDENMWTNSTPVTPEPTTVMLSGKILRRVAVAGGEDALAVGLAPVGDARPRAGGDEDRRRRAIGSTRRSAVVTSTSCGADAAAPCRAIMRDALALEQAAWCCAAGGP